jgi:hypothetical protein
MTVCPIIAPSLSATTRATISTELPAGVGTTRRTVRLGQASAQADEAYENVSDDNKSSRARRIVLDMLFDSTEVFRKEAGRSESIPNCGRSGQWLMLRIAVSLSKAVTNGVRGQSGTVFLCLFLTIQGISTNVHHPFYE